MENETNKATQLSDEQELMMLVDAYREYCDYLKAVNDCNSELFSALVETAKRTGPMRSQTFSEFTETKRIEGLAEEQLVDEINNNTSPV